MADEKKEMGIGLSIVAIVMSLLWFHTTWRFYISEKNIIVTLISVLIGLLIFISGVKSIYKRIV